MFKVYDARMKPTTISTKVACVSLVSLFAGCANKQETVAPTTTPAPAAQSCTDQRASLSKWLGQLVADGHNEFVAPDVKLVKLAAAPTPIADGLVIMISPDSVVVQGTAIGVPKPEHAVDLARDLIERLPPATNDFLYLIDGKVPWSAVAPLVDAAEAVNPKANVWFVFATDQAGAASAPEASAIDSDLATIRSGKAIHLANGPSGGVPGKVFKDCPQVTNDLFPKLSDANKQQQSALIVTELPKAIAACGCKVEMASVERLMWSWWGRDLGTYTAVSSLLARDGTKVTAKPGATWADGYTQVVEAAKQNKSLTLQ
jgi:hypothetical protein